jgi:hypothetical protein
LGIPHSLLVDLVMRRSLLEGGSTLQSLSNALRVPVPVINSIFQHLRSGNTWWK